MTVHNHTANNTIINTFVSSPARTIAKNNVIDQVIVVLNGNREQERILPEALSFARENNAELTVIVMQTSIADLYLKSLKNKLQAQYSNVTAYNFSGSNSNAAVKSVLDDCKQATVLTTKKRNLMERIWQHNFAELRHVHSNFSIREVTL